MADVTKRDILAGNLRKDILSGKYGPEGGIPEESEIVKNSGFARGTVNAALTLLEGEGLIAKRGRSYYVNCLPIIMTSYVPPAPIRHAHQGKQGYVKNIGEVKRVQEIPEHLATLLQIPATYAAVFCVRLAGELADSVEKPTQLSYRYYLLPLTDEQIQRMQDDPAYEPAYMETPEDLTSHDEPVARLATQEEEHLLALPPTTAIISLIEIIRDSEGNLIVAHESTLSPRFTMSFDFPFKNKPKP